MTQPTASSPTLILIHGASGNGQMWGPVRRHLDPRRLEVGRERIARVGVGEDRRPAAGGDGEAVEVGADHDAAADGQAAQHHRIQTGIDGGAARRGAAGLVSV